KIGRTRRPGLRGGRPGRHPVPTSSPRATAAMPTTAPAFFRDPAATGAPPAPVVIVGAGLAGLTVALHLARHGRRVIVLAKRGLSEGATSWAQGGIVGVLGSDDSIDSHVRDTQEAGG